VKRTRVDDYPEKYIRHQAQPPMRSEPEEGELRDDPSPPVSSSRLPPLPASPLHSLPIQRPRKNLQRGDPIFNELHDRYHNYGRMLKYSGDARHWSTFSPQHKEYRPLPNPPPPNSPYHKHGALIARLELLDALICFTYSIWTTDYSKDACITGSWQTEDAFLNWTKNKWTAENASGEREKAFLGLMWVFPTPPCTARLPGIIHASYMIEAFIHTRMFVFATKQSADREMDKLMAQARALVENVSAPPGSAAGTPLTGTQSTPPMLPSPASIVATSSANSTPTSRPSDTPSATGDSSASTAPVRPTPTPATRSREQPFRLGRPPPLIANSVSVEISAAFTHTLKNLTQDVMWASHCMRQSQALLTLRTLSDHFPITFTRIIHSSLSHNQEYEPDIEDEEGELFWPGAPSTGEGLGWVCLVGKAMIKEFGRDIGYLGYDGVVPKPESSSSTRPPTQRR
jgi:hypothetical protein